MTPSYEPRVVPAVRLALLLVVVAGAGAAVLALSLPWLPTALRGTAPGTVESPGTTGFADLAATGCALALLACWAWLALGTVVVGVQALLRGTPAPQAAPGWVPRTIRLVVPVLVGAAVTAAPAHAGADTWPASSPTTAVGTPWAPLAGLPLPDRVPTSGPDAPRVHRPVDRTVHQAAHPTVLVRPGDTLWAIASRLLPPGAGAAAVDRSWRRIARANTVRLPDPDLLHPGTRLRVPPLTVHPREEAR